MANNLDKLNRLRVNAGKTELRSWKASQAKLDEQIGSLENAGFKDVLPGANVDAAPVIDDPKVAAARPEPEPEAEPEVKPEPAVKRITGKPSLARGMDTDTYAQHCRTAVRDIRQKERAEKAKLSPEDKAQIKAEAALRKGEVDPKKDPDKAARQKKHIEDKQTARVAKNKAKGRTPENGRIKQRAGDHEITVAEIARELEIDPKVARAKLRRHETKIAKLHTKGQDRWTFPRTAKAELVKILK